MSDHDYKVLLDAQETLQKLMGYGATEQEKLQTNLARVAYVNLSRIIANETKSGAVTAPF